MIIIKNVQYLAPSGKFIKGDIVLEGEKIHALYPENVDGAKNCEDIILEQSEIIDLEGRKVIPGLVDMHTHGAVGYDVSDSSAEEIHEIALYQARNGITSFMPTTITDDVENIKNALKEIYKAAQMKGRGASIEGVHIEGPYINVRKKGAHNPKWITLPDKRDYDEFQDILGSLRLHMTMAPEIEGGLEFIKYIKRNGGTVGIGHTDADYEITVKAIEAGADIFTHLCNAMTGLHHRKPGVFGAALASDIPAELICDGIHVHPAVVKAVVRAKGAEGIVLVTDSMQAAGMGDGEYEFGGSKVYVANGRASQRDGTLVGSVLCLFDAVRNIVNFTEFSFEDAVRMATFNPAKVLGIDNKVGTIEEGKRGDLVVVDDDFKIYMVFCRGIMV